MYPKLPPTELPRECMQHPGEVMYVPEGWYHAVINVGDTVAVAGQRRTANFPPTSLADSKPGGPIAGVEMSLVSHSELVMSAELMSCSAGCCSVVELRLLCMCSWKPF